MKVYVVAHAPTSVQRLEDLAKLAFGYGDPVDAFVITKASGAAAQIGVPEVYKMAYKMDKKVIVLPDLDDAIELLKPDEVYTVSYDYGEKVESLEVKGTALIIVGATDPGLSKLEAQKGKPVYPAGVEGDVGPIASLAMLLKGIK